MVWESLQNINIFPVYGVQGVHVYFVFFSQTESLKVRKGESISLSYG